MLKLYNTLTKRLEEIPKPARGGFASGGKDHLNLYTCGPTVYNSAHIGNLRSYILADFLYRTLKFEGYNPNWVMNITDIDDKTIKGAVEKFGVAASVVNLREFTEVFIDGFLQDLREVNVSVDEITFVRVTNVMPQIQEFIVELINKGYAYKADDGSVYFSIEKYQADFGDYGELVGEKFLEGKKVGARVAVDEYEKENLSDFALWKAHNEATDGQIFWDHPVLGKGRPGWHIECSVINRVAFNGEVTDIHTGGVDLIFPHHTNEIAQSQALLGKNNFVHHWFHSEHLLVDGKKMSKSLGNIYTLKDFSEYKPVAGTVFRSTISGAHYQSQMNFLMENFKHKGRLKTQMGRQAENIYDGVLAAVDDNLNIPKAVGLSIKHNNGFIVPYEVFGLGIDESKIKNLEAVTDPAVIRLRDQRLQARDLKDFVKSDELRKHIEALGYEVLDTPEGQKIKKKITL
ncbi:MAG: cysteine--tRNA ligase [Patescibacteria group bacterium]